MHDINIHVRDVNDKSIIIKKMKDIHNATLYSETNKHYDQFWKEGNVYKNK
jgi:hypothetical protein